MESMGNEDNFQKSFIKLMEIYDGWKNPRKFFVFRKTSIHDKIFISAYSPFLDEAKDTIFILVACPGETWQPKKCLWLTGFLKVPNTVRSYVTLCKIRSFHSLFFSIFLCYLFHVIHILVYYTIFYLLTHSLLWPLPWPSDRGDYQTSKHRYGEMTMTTQSMTQTS